MPNGWQRLTLADVCADGGTIQTGPFGSQLHVEDYVLDGVPVVMPANIRDGHINPQGIAQVDEADAARLARHRLRDGDIVYSRRGDISQRALTRRGQTGWLCGTGCLLVRPGQGVDPTWLSYWLATPWVHDWLRGHAVGATMQNLNTGILSALPVELPPIEEQRRISGVLGALDELIDTNLVLVDALDGIYQYEWQRRFATLQDGASRKLSDVCTTQYGYTASAIKDQLGPRFLRVADINKTNWIDWTSVPFCQIGANAHERYRLHRDDLVVARMADPGKAAIVDDDVDAVFASYLVRLIPTRPHLAQFLYGLLKSQYYAEYAAGAMTGSVQKNMNAKVITGCRVELPTDASLSEFDTFGRTLRTAIGELLREKAALTRTRDDLLPLLLSARVRVEGVAV